VRPASSDVSRAASKELLGAVPLAAPVPAEAAKSAEKASFVRGMVDRSVCPCSVKWLQKSASGVGPKKPFSVAAESGGQGLARRGESAMGEGAS
jgi:hypothetical protein